MRRGSYSLAALSIYDSQFTIYYLAACIVHPAALRAPASNTVTVAERTWRRWERLRKLLRLISQNRLSSSELS